MKKQSGITLVALVITIIVLLILAVVSIRLVMNEQIIIKAEQGVDEYSDAEEYEQGQLSIAVSEMNKYVGTVSGVDLKVGDYIDYYPLLDENGKTVSVQSYTSYSETNATADKNNGRTSGYTSDQTFSVSATTNGWRVLSIENGQIQLISANPIKTTSNANYYLKNLKGYLNAEDELNSICSIFGQGKGADSARSLNVDDIDKLSKITTDEQKKALSSNYGSLWQYQFPEGGTYLQYRKSTDDGTTWTTWNNISSTTSFYQTFRVSENVISSTNPGKSEILKYTAYGYNISDYIKDSTISNMITNGTSTSVITQWLASNSIELTTSSGALYVRSLSDKLSNTTIFTTFGGGGFQPSCAVRPVVTLNANVEIDTSDSTKDGKSASTAYELKAQ